MCSFLRHFRVKIAKPRPISVNARRSAKMLVPSLDDDTRVKAYVIEQKGCWQWRIFIDVVSISGLLPYVDHFAWLFLAIPIKLNVDSLPNTELDPFC